jgi:hypothetical protein
MVAAREQWSEEYEGKFDYDEKVTILNNGEINVRVKINPLNDMKLNRVALVPKLNYETCKGELYDAVIDGKQVKKKFPDDNKNEWIQEKAAITRMEVYHHLLPYSACVMEFPTTPSQIEKWGLKFDIFNLAKYEYPDIPEGKGHVLEVKIKLPENSVVARKKKGKIVIDLNKKICSINKEIFGVNVHQPALVYPANLLTDKDIQRLLKDMDAAHLRMCISCLTLAYHAEEDPLAPYDGAEYNFELIDKWLDFVINDLKKHIILTTGYYCPPWLSKQNKNAKGQTSISVVYRNPPKDPEKLADIIAAVVKHCNIDKGLKIRYVEIGNEPDLDEYWVGGTFEEYMDTYRAQYRKVKEADPTVLVSGPATAGFSDERMEKFLDAFIDESDIISWHQYGSNRFSSNYNKIMEMIDKRKKGAKKLTYMSEFNISAGSSESRWMEVEGAVWGAKAYKNLIESGTDMAAWYQFAQGLGFIDDDPLETHPTYHMFKMYTVYGNFDGADLIKTSKSSPENIEILGCRNGSDFALMYIKDEALIANTEKITIKGLEKAQYKVKVYLLDDTHSAEVIDEFELNGRKTNSFNYDFNGGTYLILFAFEKV